MLNVQDFDSQDQKFVVDDFRKIIVSFGVNIVVNFQYVNFFVMWLFVDLKVVSIVNKCVVL